MNAVAVHPAGYVAGVNTTSHKLEILRLEEEPQPDDTSVQATLKSGPGTRIGLMHSPVAVSVTPDGTILVLEAGNNRIQAFDVSANAVAYFADKTSPTMALRDPVNTAVYLDMKVEVAGYIYVLGYSGGGMDPGDYFLDIYEPSGTWLSRTQGLPAARIAVDYWRTVYSLNYESFVGPNGLTEPSLSQWTPSTPESDAPNTITNPSICGS
jgi:DNA-binding beta-propeller fold protein YncE